MKNELFCYYYNSIPDHIPDLPENYLPVQYQLTENYGTTTLEIKQGLKSKQQNNCSAEN